VSDTGHHLRVEESRAPDTATALEPDESLLVGSRMTFRERLEWNEGMVALWARWNPDLAHSVWIEREPIR
jgi:hypothetical protein